MILVLAALVVTSGCETGDRAYEGMVRATDPDKTTLQTTVTWMNPQPRIRPVSGNQMVVYVRVKNSAGADMDLVGSVMQQIQGMGYRITTNIDEAQFTINADLRHFGEGSEKSYTPVVAGAAVGAGAGAVVGNNMGSGHTAEGAVAGAVIGGLIGNVAANRNKMREINLIVDVTIGERIEGGVQSARRSGTDDSTTHSAGVVTQGVRETGRSTSTSSETQSVNVKEEFLYHQNRVTASARRMNLTLLESQPVLTQKLSLAIANALP